MPGRPQPLWWGAPSLLSWLWGLRCSRRTCGAWNSDWRYVKETPQAQIVMAEKKAKKNRGTPQRRQKLAGNPIGLEARELLTTATPSDVGDLQEAIEEDGGKVLASYREPFGGHWLIMAALPIEKVEPTPYQRNLSDSHARKLESVIAKL